MQAACLLLLSILVIAPGLVVQTIFAQETPSYEVAVDELIVEEIAVEALAKALAKINTMQATFEQTVVNEMSNTESNEASIVDQASGWMAWQQPDKFRWEVTSPMQQSILIDAKQYFQYDKDLDQMLVQPLSEEIALLPKLLLSGNAEKIAKRFSVKRVEKLMVSNAFILTPLDGAALFGKVLLDFHDGRLKLMAITDELGQTNTFYFIENNEISDNNQPLFHLEPAPGTDVIYQ